MSIAIGNKTLDLLAELNTLRAQRNQPALKSWKGSRTALEQTITAYQIRKVEPAVAEGAYPNARVAEHATGMKGTDEKARQRIAKANKATFAAQRLAERTAEAVPSTSTKETAMTKPTKPAKKSTKEKTKSDSGLVSLADIARELKIEPKLARAKARRNADLQKLAQGDAWEFKPADVKKVKAILAGK